MNSSCSVVIVDLAAGNLNSVCRALGRVGVNAEIANSAKTVERADKIALPGVGHFARAMGELRAHGLIDALNYAALIEQKPILGICLGMELMAGHSEEGDAEGLGWVDAEALRFQFSDRQRFKVPHMGWNSLNVKENSRLLKGVDERDEFYFAHSYYLKPDENGYVTAMTTYETTFPSVIERDNIFGVQFHPEKSHAAGLKVLRNFAAV